ncbi:Endonuclease/exonuclease/phosphatase [Schizophyllum amplum]|uniref:Endonuclease/exonuclease/phosphatase n=1 Tax=Schizophyllum amplum TaxID=97359 RepID=A0A550C6M4_9AGAR|nr:Endonuclease/exonuclease/phosphatase [Auriculariopsis ampla]
MHSRITCPAAIIGALSLLLTSALPATAMRIGSWNLRYDSQPNNITVSESFAALGDPLPWSTRRVRAAELLLNKGVEVIGFQEALIRQVNDLDELLGSDWSWVGVGRDDGVEAGEFSAIFWKNSTMQLLDWDSFWTSNTPFEPSKYPDAGSYRICTVAHFQPASGPQLTVLNTHMDDQSDDQRRLAASLIVYRARYEAVNTGGPVLVMGDFNSPPTGDDSGAYNIATGATTPPPSMPRQTERRSVSSNFATFTGFTAPGNASSWGRIDFVFGGSNGGWTADAYHVDPVLTDDGLYISDHRPVFVDVSVG